MLANLSLMYEDLGNLGFRVQGFGKFRAWGTIFWAIEDVVNGVLGHVVLRVRCFEPFRAYGTRFWQFRPWGMRFCPI